MKETTDTTEHNQDTNAVSPAPDDAGPGEERSAEETDWQAEAEKWKALARKHETRSKENFEKAQEYDKYLESQKSEDQKREEATQALHAERDKALRDAALARAALAYGLSEDDIGLIAGGDPEDINERAQKLAERLQSVGKQKSFATYPDPRLGRESKPTGSGDWLRDQLQRK